MKIKSFLTAILVSITVFAIGVGDEVELDRLVNGRCTAKFRPQDNNIRLVLPRGTKGRVLEVKRFNSGNLGFLLEITDGPQAGQVVWVYYNPTSPSLRLMTARGQFTRSPEESSSAQTTRDVPARRDPCSEPPSQPTAPDAPVAPPAEPPSAPVAPPSAPVAPPAEPPSAPVAPPSAPVAPPAEPPSAPVAPPSAPVAPPAPMQGPVQVNPPVTPPAEPPVAPPVAPPVTPPADGGVQNGGSDTVGAWPGYTPQDAVNDVLSGRLTYVGRGIPNPILDQGGAVMTDGASQYCVWKNSRVYVIHQGCRPSSSQPVSVLSIEVFKRTGGQVDFMYEPGSTYNLNSITSYNPTSEPWLIGTKQTPAIQGEPSLQQFFQFYVQVHENYSIKSCTYGNNRNLSGVRTGELTAVCVPAGEPPGWRMPTSAFQANPFNFRFREAHDAIRFGQRR